MDAVYPGAASALARGRRLRRGPQRQRTRTQPVTFAEIKEVDEDSELVVQGGIGGGGRGGAGSVERVSEERRRRDQLASEPRTRRRDVNTVIPEPPEECRASSEPPSPPPPPAAPAAPAPPLQVLTLDSHVSTPNP